MLAGCDGVFGLTHIYDHSDAGADDSAVVADSSPLCTKETFREIGDVLTRWIRVSSGPGFDTSVESEQLVMRVPAMAAGNTYVRTLEMFDMTDATASIEVPRAIGLIASETYFAIKVDMLNFYLLDVVNGMLTMRVRNMGVDSQVALLNYDSVAHRFWRFQHKKLTSQMAFLTSDDGVTYTMRHMLDAEVPVGPMRIELGVATSGAGLAVGSEAQFDNLEICPP